MKSDKSETTDHLPIIEGADMDRSERVVDVDREILLEHVSRIYEIARPAKPGALISPVRRTIAEIALEALQKVGAI